MMGAIRGRSAVGAAGAFGILHTVRDSTHPPMHLLLPTVMPGVLPPGLVKAGGPRLLCANAPIPAQVPLGRQLRMLA